MLPVNTCNCVSGYCSTCCDCCKHIVPHTLVENVALCKTSDESKHQASGKFAVFGILHKKKGCYFLQGDARVVPCSQLAMELSLFWLCYVESLPGLGSQCESTFI